MKIRTAIMLLSIAFAAVPALGRPAAAQSDEFNIAALQASWFWIREDPSHWSLKLRPGYLRITTQRGDLAGTLNYNARNVLLQGTKSGDFVLATRVRILPTYDYDQGGLIVYANDDNYVKLVRSHVLKDGGGVVELITEVAGKMTFLSLRLTASDVYLRLTRTGTSYKGEYSLSGKPSQWFTVGSASATLDSPKVGLLAISGPLPNVPEIPADFDYFRGSGPGIGVIAPSVVGVPRIGTIVFVDLAAEPDAFYQIGAALGSKPGIPLGTRNVPLNADPLLVLTLNGGLAGVFHHLTGYLSARGESRAWMSLPDNRDLVGVEMALAFVTFGAGKPFGIATISKAATIKIAS